MAKLLYDKDNTTNQMANITMNTDWGADGAQLTGQEVQAFIKEQFLSLIENDGIHEERLDELEAMANPAVALQELDSLGSVDTEAMAKDRSKVYNVVGTSGIVLGKALIFASSANRVYQLVIGNFTRANDNTTLTRTNSPEILWRFYAKNGYQDVEEETWSSWYNLVDEQVASSFEAVYERITPTVNVSDLDDMVMNKDKVFFGHAREKTTIFNVVDNDEYIVGKLMMISDNIHHVLAQFLISFYTPEALPGGPAHDRNLCIMYRTFGTGTAHGPMMAWSEWRRVGQKEEPLQTTGNDESKPMSQAAVTKLIKSLCTVAGIGYYIVPTTGEIVFSVSTDNNEANSESAQEAQSSH